MPNSSDYPPAFSLAYRRVSLGPLGPSDRPHPMIGLSDLLDMPQSSPRRGRGRPAADEDTLERRRLVAWLADSGTLPIPKVCRVAGIAERTLREWRQAIRDAERAAQNQRRDTQKAC